ncbi:glutathione S-transferase family protein [Parapedomonas caeni]|jgi:glutathione S-transferase
MSGIDYLPIEAARAATGLRVAFTQGVPNPWGFGARAILDIKRIPYLAVAQEAGGANDALKAWTGQTSAPVAMLDDERPRALWSEIVVLAEQLAPEPPLVPAVPEERALMFGLCHELCGDDGLGWNARTLIFAANRAAGNDAFESMYRKYSSPSPVEHARRRVADILGLLDRQLAAQTARGRDYLVGDRLSAADLYWAGFSNLFVAMAPDLCAMPDFYRALGAITCGHLSPPVPSRLLDHRDRVVRDHLDTPVAF